VIRAEVRRSIMTFGTDVWLLDEDGIGQRPNRVLRLRKRSDDSGTYTDGDWEPITYDGCPTDPTLSLPDDFLRALLEALSSYYSGPMDARSLRADLDKERARTDTLIGHLAAIAANRSEPQP
jgi:hypothetical protein